MWQELKSGVWFLQVSIQHCGAWLCTITKTGIKCKFNRHDIEPTVYERRGIP